MTQEEKAKAYDEVVNKLRHFMAQGIDPLITRADVQDFFPELKESEDERIRNVIRGWIYSQPASFFDNGISKEDWLAWLEKQGDKSQGKTALEAIHEEKVDNAIKVEPTFKVGDWITFYGDKPFKILKVESEQNGILDYLLLSQNGHDSYYNKKYVDENARLWTIQDAKDGDVLASELCDSIILFRGIKDNNIDFYCDYDFSKIDIPGDRFAVNNGQHYGNIEDSKDFHPATKEQRDLLFQKMKEAGYECNADKKELKKIEDEEYNGEDYGIDSLYHAQRILEKTLGKVDGYQTDDGILSHECAITAVKKLCEQKPKWSNEDEHRVKDMTKEDKKILLKDLCARLPYEVKVQYNNEIYNIDYISALYEEVKLDIPNNYTIGISEIKPYLRPMSSMTEKEKETYHNLCYEEEGESFEFGEWVTRIYYHDTIDSIDYLNSIYVDYCDLIPKGFALVAPEGIYKVEEQQ